MERSKGMLGALALILAFPIVFFVFAVGLNALGLERTTAAGVTTVVVIVAGLLLAKRF